MCMRNNDKSLLLYPADANGLIARFIIADIAMVCNTTLGPHKPFNSSRYRGKSNILVHTLVTSLKNFA
jgi:hypothetical protein